MTHIVIIGAGIAGLSAAEAARSASSGLKITIVNEEPVPPYYRLNLTRLLAGEITRDSIFIHAADWYSRKDLKLLGGRKAVSIASSEHTVALDDNSSIDFDRLILAPGARACLPEVPGITLQGVTPIRTLADTDFMIEAIASSPKCVCVGAGTLGIETAGALSARGLSVTLLERHEWLMGRHLSRAAGTLLEGHLAGKGIRVEKNADMREIRGDLSVHEVALSGGRVIPARLVVVATGITPHLNLAATSKIRTNRGIVVDETMRTSAQDIFAAGDAAEYNGAIYGTWAPARQQGVIAGLAAAGETAKSFTELPRSNSLKVLGMSISSIGNVQPECGTDEMLEENDGDGLYQFVFRDGRMRGCILMGNTHSTAAAKKAIESGADFSQVLSKEPTARKILKALLK